MGLFESKLAMIVAGHTNDIGKIHQFVERANSDITNLQKNISELLLMKQKFDPLLKLVDEFGSDNLEKLSALANDYNDKVQLAIFENTTEYLSSKEVAEKIGIPGLNGTTLKYFLYEEKILDLNFNQKSCSSRASYKISSEYELINHEIKKFIHIETPTHFSFDKEVVDFLIDCKDKIYESIERNKRRRKRYEEAKESLLKKESDACKNEINKICGISKNNNYVGAKYGKLYDVYAKTVCKTIHSDYDKYLSVHNLTKDKFTKLKYIIYIRKHGDILLRLACELFVI